MGGELTVGGSTTVNGIPASKLRPGSDGGVLLGQYQNFVLDPDVPHPAGWQGDTNGDGVLEGAAGGGYGTTPVTQANMVLPFSFFGQFVYMGTNPISYQSGEAYSAPSADVDLSSCAANVCTLALDLSAWEVMWNGNAFQQGPRPDNTGPFVLAEGTYNLDTQFYSVTWTSHIKGGSFNGVIATWHLEGTHVGSSPSTVPVPASLWLLGSGLVGLIGVARRAGNKQCVRTTV
jgi:hypothetical protein